MNQKVATKKGAAKKTTPIHPKLRKKTNIHPALRTVLVYLGPSALVRIITALVGVAWLGGLIQLVLYFFCGYSAGNEYYVQNKAMYPRGRPTEQLRNGAAAGMTLGILLTIILVILLLIAGSTVVGVPFVAGGSAMVFWAPFDILSGLFLGAWGGSMSAKVRK